MFHQKKMSKLMKREDGQGMVEFAMILPIFLCILCAVVEFGWIFMHEINVTNAAREGARKGITCVSDADFDTKVNTSILQAAPNLDTSNLAISIVKNDVSGGKNVEVKLDYSLKTLTPVGNLLYGSTFHVKGFCTMKAGG